MNLFGRRNKRIVITAQLFTSMVFGYTAECDGVEMIFEDMGFDLMCGIIRNAEQTAIMKRWHVEERSAK